MNTTYLRIVHVELFIHKCSARSLLPTILIVESPDEQWSVNGMSQISPQNMESNVYVMPCPVDFFGLSQNQH